MMQSRNRCPMQFLSSNAEFGVALRTYKETSEGKNGGARPPALAPSTAAGAYVRRAKLRTNVDAERREKALATIATTIAIRTRWMSVRRRNNSRADSDTRAPTAAATEAASKSEPPNRSIASSQGRPARAASHASIAATSPSEESVTPAQCRHGERGMARRSNASRAPSFPRASTSAARIVSKSVAMRQMPRATAPASREVCASASYESRASRTSPRRSMMKCDDSAAAIEQRAVNAICRRVAVASSHLRTQFFTRPDLQVVPRKSAAIDLNFILSCLRASALRRLATAPKDAGVALCLHRNARACAVRSLP